MMKTHPISESPYCWIPVLMLSGALIAVQIALLRGYAGAEWLPAVTDSVTTVVWLAVLAYAAGFIAGYVSLFRTDVVIVAGGSLLWLAGCYMVCDIMTGIAGLAYIPFAQTIPFRLLFGIPALTAIMLWYRLNAASDADSEEPNYTAEREPRQQEFPQEETIDRITVKDRSRIHLIEAGELLCIQACGDYVTLTTAEGEYLQEQTMIYFETHLPAETFVRIHRSAIVNIRQIARIELFGKETYMVLLKNGIKLRASLSGYRLLKERLGL